MWDSGARVAPPACRGGSLDLRKRRISSGRRFRGLTLAGTSGRHPRRQSPPPDPSRPQPTDKPAPPHPRPQPRMRQSEDSQSSRERSTPHGLAESVRLRCGARAHRDRPGAALTLRPPGRRPSCPRSCLRLSSSTARRRRGSQGSRTVRQHRLGLASESIDAFPGTPRYGRLGLAGPALRVATRRHPPRPRRRHDAPTRPPPRPVERNRDFKPDSGPTILRNVS